MFIKMEMRNMLRAAALPALLLAAILISCGGHSHKSPNMLRAAPRPAATLENALAEIAALQTPPGVDAKVFDQLKASLKAALLERFAREGKIAAKAPQGDVNIVDNLDFGQNLDLDWELTWTYKNVGDYNQDGIVNVADLTVLAMKFNMSATTPDVQVADGNNDDTISVMDITPIAMHWYEEVANYRIEKGPAATGPWTEIGTLDLAGGQRPDGGIRQFTFLLAEYINVWYRVVPVDSGDADGIPGQPVHFLPMDGFPVVTNVTPTSGMSGTDITLVAEMVGQPPFTYVWDFGGAGTPATSTDESPVLTLGAPGVYANASVTAANIWGSMTYDFAITVNQPPPTNLFTLTASSTDINVGDTVTITAKAEDLAYAFTSLDSTLIGYEVAQLEPDIPTFNTGSPGGGMYDLDGIWGMGTFADFMFPVPAEIYFQYLDGVNWVWQNHPIVPALNSIQVNLTPPSGSVPARTTGNLFNFNMTAKTSGMAVLWAVAEYDLGGTMLPVTSYYDDTLPTGVRHLFAISPPLMINIQPAAAEAPTVNWVSPTTGETGATAVFAASVSGSPPFTYSWDFSVGANPGTSTEPMPQVTLGAGGQYFGNLHIDGAAGSTDFPFTYWVTDPDYDEVESNDNDMAANILPTLPVAGFRGSIGPGGYDGDTWDYFRFNGTAGDKLEITLLSNQTGEIRLDLIEGPNVLTFDERQPPMLLNYTLPDTGEYVIGVTCPTPPAAAMDYRLFVHTETWHQWNYYTICNSGSTLYGFSMALVNGVPCVAFANADDELFFACSDNLYGDGTWSVYNTGILTVFDRDLNLIDVNGLPAVAFIDAGGQVYASFCETADGSGTWNTYQVSNSLMYKDVAFAMIGSNPTLAYYYDDGVERYVYYAIPDMPPDYSSWTSWQLLGPTPYCTGISLVVLDNNCPAVSYGISPSFAASPSPIPSPSSTWDTDIVETGWGANWGTSLFLNDGPDAGNECPAMLYANNTGALHYAINDAKDGSGMWTAQEIPFVIRAPSFSLPTHTLYKWTGWPMMLLETPDGGIRFTRNNAEDGSGAWLYETAAGDGMLGGNTCFANVQSRPSFAYTDHIGQYLYFAQRAP